MQIPKLYTVENVRKGHPDKVCDQISDAILDAYLTQDPQARVAIESFGAHGLLTMGGEITSTADVDVEKIARDVYRSIGFDSKIEVVTRIVKQSPEIALGVDRDGAGDQGVMYGYAVTGTNELLPKGVVFAANITRRLDQESTKELLPWLLPDGKVQVTMEDGDIKTIIVSVQHQKNVHNNEVVAGVTRFLVDNHFDPKEIKFIINPAGDFTMGGFDADAGLTGRKIMIDSYGGVIPHGGGCFSGKDATKVDRSGAYMARFAAKNLVAAGYGKEVLVSVAYAIGQADPVMLTAHNEDGKDLSDILKKHFDFRPKAIIERLGLREPIFQKTAAYGHFIDQSLPWEQIIKIVE